jgi:hypothetical protein
MLFWPKARLTKHDEVFEVLLGLRTRTWLRFDALGITRDNVVLDKVRVPLPGTDAVRMQ